MAKKGTTRIGFKSTPKKGVGKKLVSKTVKKQSAVNKKKTVTAERMAIPATALPPVTRKMYRLGRASKTIPRILTEVPVVIYNQYTGQLFVADSTYELQDGDIIQTADSYYTLANGKLGADAPQNSEVTVPTPPPDFTIDAFVVDAVTGDVLETYLDVMSYDAAPQTQTNAADYWNYPDSTVAPDTEDPGTVEVDLSFFDSYEQYYDDSENPVYTGSSCESSIGIRG